MSEIRINVKGDVSAITRDLRWVDQHIVPEATRDALNKTNKGIITDGVRGLSSHLGIMQKKIRRRLTIPPFGFNATKRRQKAGGVVLFNYVPEIWIGPKGRKVRREKEGTNKFLATMKNGHTGFFRRRTVKQRLPIDEFFVDIGAKASAFLDNVIETSGRSRFLKNFESEIKRRLRRRRR